NQLGPEAIWGDGTPGMGSPPAAGRSSARTTALMGATKPRASNPAAGTFPLTSLGRKEILLNPTEGTAACCSGPRWVGAWGCGAGMFDPPIKSEGLGCKRFDHDIANAH